MSNEINSGNHKDSMVFETLNVRRQEAVLFVEMDAPPMNLMGPGMVSDLVSLIQQAENDQSVQILVFTSKDPDYFISHVDVTKIKEVQQAARSLDGKSSLGELFQYMSKSRLITIAQIEGRVRGVGSEFVLACDMRFAAIETAIFNQFEPTLGVIPGAGATQHLTRLLGRGRAMEVLFSAEDYGAELAERYGWINRALPAKVLGDFVSSLAYRISKFPAVGRLVVKERVNAIGLPSNEEIIQDMGLFIKGIANPEFLERMKNALKNGFQTPERELDLPSMLAEL